MLQSIQTLFAKYLWLSQFFIFLSYDQCQIIGANQELSPFRASMSLILDHFKMSSIHLRAGLPGWRSPSTAPNINIFSKWMSSGVKLGGIPGDLRSPTSNLGSPTSDLGSPTSDVRSPISSLRPPASSFIVGAYSCASF